MAETTEDIYDRAGMTNEVGFGDSPALIVVDLQKGFTDPEHDLGGDLTDVVERTNALLGAAHDAGVPVVFTTIETSHENHADLGIWTEKIPALTSLQTGSEWVELDDRLDVASTDHVVSKRQASAFHETELESMLSYWQTDTIVVAGCTTSGCIRATVVDGCSHGYRAIVPEGSVGDRAAEPHEANLFDINAKYGDVRPVDQVVEYLGNSGSE